MSDNKILSKESERKSAILKKKNFLVIFTEWIGEFDLVKLIQKARKKREAVISK